MAWVEITLDLKRTADALCRIADALERLIPPMPEHSNRKPAIFINTDPADIADAETERDRKREAGTEDTV